MINFYTTRTVLNIFLPVLLLTAFSAYSQDELPCANEAFQQKLFEEDVFKAEFAKINASIQRQRIAGVPDELYVIPIAVHVIHKGEPVGTGSNISDQQIIDAVRGANERWRNMNGLGVDMNVQFCLAQFDPHGNPSNGIDRVDGRVLPNYEQYGISYVEALGEPGSNEEDTKNLSNWPHTYVFNIWVVHRIAGDWGGYCFFPFTFNYPTDGVVITANSMTYNSTTLAHEIGHGMGLFHTFQASENGCPSNNVCFLEGDWVCDTPPHKKSECVSNGANCSSSPDSVLQYSFKNYMSYCPGRNIFTAGQKERSRLAIKSSTRWTLTKSYACSGPPCDTARTTVNTITCDASVPTVQFDTLATSKGCDSIVKTVSLYIPPVQLEQTAVTCDAASLGTKYDTLTAVSGCDSIIRTVTALQQSPVAAFTVIQNGDTVVFTNASQHADVYEWNFGDDSLSVLASPAHVYPPGNYHVVLTASNSCGTDTASEDIIIQLTGIEKNSFTNAVSVFPNPNHGVFTLNTGAGITGYEIINILGKVVWKDQVNGKSISVAAKLSKGVYHIVLKSNSQVAHLVKLVIL
jgi:PKD repeat protein